MEATPTAKMFLADWGIINMPLKVCMLAILACCPACMIEGCVLSTRYELCPGCHNIL